MMRIPRYGKWRLKESGPVIPFDTMEINFELKWGMVVKDLQGAFLTNITTKNLPVWAFTARYNILGKSGALEARLRDDGSLDVIFDPGNALFKCVASPMKLIHWDVKKMAI